MSGEEARRCDVKVVFSGGIRALEFPLNLMDRDIDHIEVDGARFVRARERDWDDVEVTD